MGRVIVIGGGVMGSALGIHLGRNGHRVNIWGTQWDEEIIKEMKETRRHPLHGVDLDKNISLFYHREMEEAFRETSLVILAVISQGMAAISKSISPYLNKDHRILSITKGIDGENLKTMSSIIEDSMAEELRGKIGIIKLGGPLIAQELAQGKFSEGVFASKDLESARYAASLFKSRKFKVNISNDIRGVELCGAFKNPYAIAMGIIEGLEKDSNNSKAALMARGSIEMANIVETYGGDRETALGLGGVGDYYVTSQGGRNGRFGILLGQGKNKDQALEIMNHQTVEGLPNSLNGYKFLKKMEEEGRIRIKEKAPLFLQIYKILYEDKPVRQAMEDYWKEEGSGQ